jgi:hypothetical protein
MDLNVCFDFEKKQNKHYYSTANDQFDGFCILEKNAFISRPCGKLIKSIDRIHLSREKKKNLQLIVDYSIVH